MSAEAKAGQVRLVFSEEHRRERRDREGIGHGGDGQDGLSAKLGFYRLTCRPGGTTMPTMSTMPKSRAVEPLDLIPSCLALALEREPTAANRPPVIPPEQFAKAGLLAPVQFTLGSDDVREQAVIS